MTITLKYVSDKASHLSFETREAAELYEKLRFFFDNSNCWSCADLTSYITIHFHLLQKQPTSTLIPICSND